MAERTMQGGASALPIAHAFLATGGRLLMNPQGTLEPTISVERLFGANVTPAEARRGYVIGRRFIRRLRCARFARSVQALVVQQGERTPNGWLVMEQTA